MTFPFLSPQRAERLRLMLATGRMREMILFLLVGGTGAVLYTGLNVLFTTAGIRPSISIVITLAILVPPIYYAQHRLTFQSDRDHWSAFPRYLGAQVFGNVLAMIAAELFPAPIRSYPLTSFIIIAGMVAVTNYGILKFWAFRRPAATADRTV